MKILILQGGFDSGGAEKNVALLAADRIARGDDVAVAGMYMPLGGSFFPYPGKVRLYVMTPIPECSGIRLHLRRLRWLSTLIRYEKPDLVVSFLIKINVLAAIAARRNHTPVILCERNNPHRQASPFWRLAHRHALRGASAIVMQTERARAALPARLRDRSAVIHNPCPVIDFTPEPGSDRCRITAVGRLVPQKGFDMLIDAFALVARDAREVTLTIFGEGPERTALEARIERLGLSTQVRLPGRSAGPADWLRQTDLLIVSSRYEGYMNVISEASVSGIPIVAFDCDFGPAEQIIPGVNGILVPPENTQALASAMGELIFNSVRRYALTDGVAGFRKMLDPQVILAQWDRLIETVSASRTAPEQHPDRQGW